MTWAVRVLLSDLAPEDLTLAVQQWVDTDAAAGWFREIAYQLGRSSPAELPTYAAMGQRVRDLAHAVGQCCRALDLPLPVVAGYRDAVSAALGNVGGWYQDDIIVPADGWLDRASRAAEENGGGWYQNARDSATSPLLLHARVWLDERGLVDTAWLDGDPVGTDGATEWVELYNEGSFAQRNAWSGWKGRTRNGAIEFVVPLSCCWELLERAARAIVDDGIDGTLLQSQATAATANADVFEHLPAAELGRLGISGPEQLASVAEQMHAHLVTDPYHVAADDSRITPLRLAMGAANSIAGAAAAGAAVAGAAPFLVVAGLLVGLTELLLRLLPSAAGRPSPDVWGRMRPVAEGMALSGDPVRLSPPVFRPDPVPVRYSLVVLRDPSLRPVFFPARTTSTTGGSGSSGKKKSRRRYRTAGSTRRRG